MFESFRTFISEFANGEKHPSQFADNDYRLAAAALLVHAAAIDGDMSQAERLLISRHRAADASLV